MSKRILYVTGDLDRYGADSQLLTLARHLPRDQFDVHVCSLSEAGEMGSELEQAQIPLTSVSRRWPCDPLAAARLRRLVDRLQPDLIHTGGFDAAVYSQVAWQCASKARWIASASAITSRGGWPRAALEKMLAGKTSAVVTADEAARDQWARQGRPAEKLVVIPPGFSPTPKNHRPRAEVTGQIGLPESVFLIGLLGRLEVEQGWREVVWTLDILRCLRDDVHVVVIGDGRQRWQLERFARLCTLDLHVHFLGRRADVAELLPHLNHVWRGPGHGELAVAAGEALAAGVPVVASDTRENRELVIHDQTGFLVPIGGRAARARYANRLINDSALRNRLGEAGRLRTTTHFNLETMVRRHVELYHRLVGE